MARQLYIVALPGSRYVVKFHRTRHLPSLQYHATHFTGIRAEACTLPYNVAASVARANRGQVHAA